MKKFLFILTALAVFILPFGGLPPASANLVLSVVTPVPNPTFDTTPDITIKSTKSGELLYGGECIGNKNYIAAGQELTITFNELDYGLYDNCTITIKYTEFVNGYFQFFAEALPVPEFEVRALLLPPTLPDIIAPVLTEVAEVASPTFDTTPEYIFHSTEPGDITYAGGCVSTEDKAVEGNNKIIFNELSPGTYDSCTIVVTDAAGNKSLPLEVSTFIVMAKIIIPDGVLTPNDYCAGFTDVHKLDSDCTAITYVKSIGAMTGNPNGTFEPDANLQRDQIAKISLETFNLFNAAKNYCSGNPFPDVTTNAWSYQYICRGVELGMITGYAAGADAGYYRPARSVNRVEFLALILRNLNDTMPGVNSVSYKDVAAGQWFSGFAKYSYDHSLFTGANLYPDQFVTRREVARTIYQLNQLGKF